MRKKFYLKDLAESGYYYHPMFEAIYCANWHYYNNCQEHPNKVDNENIRCSIWNYLALGLDDFIDIESTLLAYNRCFAKLLKMGEIKVAYPLIRLQVENLAAIYAETLHPFKVLYTIFNTNKTLGNDVIAGVKFNKGDLLKEVDEKFNTRTYQIYKKYCNYIHPSKEQRNIAINWRIYDGDVTVNKKDLRLYSTDMITVNQTIGNVLLAHLENINSKINDNEPNNV